MSDTIAAIATGAVRSAIGILRVSGEGAVGALSAVFSPGDGRPLEGHDCHRLVYGTLRDAAGRPIDQALATFSRAPASYTGEDTAEVQCHGSPAVLALGLEALFAHGARQAGPGEFTQRAFLNGKLDLTQAEAVMDLIDAESANAVHNAVGQLAGALSRRVQAVYDGLVDVMAHFCAVLDYPDEELDAFDTATIAAALTQAHAGLSALLESYHRGRQLVGGVPCAIVGPPNAGKSSLLNALAGYERAIVTPIPGTTRDTIEVRVNLGGVALRLIDTAGLRESQDPIEQLGVARSRAALEGAELALVLFDGSSCHGPDGEIWAQATAQARHAILVCTKADLPAGGDWGDRPMVPVSAVTGAGLEALAQAVAACFPAGSGDVMGEILTNARQAESAQRALRSVEEAQKSLAAGITPDAVLMDVEAALAALGELTGARVREDITGRIFSRFCVGK